jgi:Flavoprotein
MRGTQPLPGMSLGARERNRITHSGWQPGGSSAGWLVIPAGRFYARCMARKSWVLTVVVSGAGAASDVGTLVKEALARGWVVQVVATPSALAFFDGAAIEALTGSPVRSAHRSPGEPRSRIPDAIVVAPATFNLLNQWALGVADSYALAVLAEQTGMAIPTVVLPAVSAPLAARPQFARSVKALRAEGVSVLLGPGGSAPSGAADDDFPWRLALDEAAEMIGFGG